MNERWKYFTREEDRLGAQFLRMTGGIPSGPVDLCTRRIHKKKVDNTSLSNVNYSYNKLMQKIVS